jgi:adenine-specific DNA methylase
MRLTEVDFPIAVVPKHAAREMSIRHGHPSTLHLWERGPDFMRPSNARSALYPRDSEEKRLVDAMLPAAPSR